MSGPPLEITIDSIALPQVMLGAPVIGVEAELSASGSATLTEEALAAKQFDSAERLAQIRESMHSDES